MEMMMMVEVDEVVVEPGKSGYCLEVACGGCKTSWLGAEV